MTKIETAPAHVVETAPSPTPVPGAALAVSWRLLRRGAVLLWLVTGAYLAMEVLVFRNAYPDDASRQRLVRLATSTAARLLQGVPSGVDTAGGFAVWDGGWMLMIIIGSWASLAATKMARGEEDSSRAELVLSRAVSSRQVLLAHLAALALAAAGLGVAAALPFVVLGEAWSGAVAWGLGLAGLCVVSGAVGLLVAQLVAPRQRSVAVTLGLLAAVFLVRLTANSAASRRWLLTVVPFGWLDRVRPYSDDNWLWLLAPVIATAVLAGAALVVRGRRDAGAAPFSASARHRSSFRLLDSASGFGWRATSGALLAWTVTSAVVTFVFGAMTGAIVNFINDDKTYRDMLASMGVDTTVPAVGYLSYIAVFVALPFAVFVSWRIGAVRSEEESGRLDNLLVRGVVRWRWLTVTFLHALVAAGIVIAFTVAATWVGVTVADAPVTAWQVIGPLLGTIPLVALFGGLAVLAFGVVPRLTAALPSTLAVLGYLLDTIGTTLKWPGAVLDISPFHHLARLPGQPMTLTAVITLTAIGAVAAAAGVFAFTRRDLRGA